MINLSPESLLILILIVLLIGLIFGIILNRPRGF